MAQRKDDEDIMVTIDLEDGSTIDCEIITIFEYNGRDYIALLPWDENGKPNKDGIYYLYRYNEDENGEGSIENIEDDEEFEAVDDRFDELQDEALYEQM